MYIVWSFDLTCMCYARLFYIMTGFVFTSISSDEKI